MKGLIVSNGYFDNNSTISQRQEIIDEFTKRGVAIDVIKSNTVPALIEDTDVKLLIQKYDFCIFLDKDVILANMLEKAGITLFNSAEAIRVCDDKMLTYVTLAGNGIKMPKTISSPLMYTENQDKKFLEKVSCELGFPIVVKNVYGSMGKSVWLAENSQQLEELFLRLRRFPHLYQKFVGKGYGEDIRVITVGKKVVSAMKRINENDFRSNIELGGRGEAVTLTEKQIQLAEKVSQVLNLDYAGIDIIDEDYVGEVNSNAFFREFEKVTGEKVAEKYVEYIINKIGDIK